MKLYEIHHSTRAHLLVSVYTMQRHRHGIKANIVIMILHNISELIHAILCKAITTVSITDFILPGCHTMISQESHALSKVSKQLHSYALLSSNRTCVVAKIAKCQKIKIIRQNFTSSSCNQEITVSHCPFSDQIQ